MLSGKCKHGKWEKEHRNSLIYPNHIEDCPLKRSKDSQREKDSCRLVRALSVIAFQALILVWPLANRRSKCGLNGKWRFKRALNGDLCNDTAAHCRVAQWIIPSNLEVVSFVGCSLRAARGSDDVVSGGVFRPGGLHAFVESLDQEASSGSF